MHIVPFCGELVKRRGVKSEDRPGSSVIAQPRERENGKRENARPLLERKGLDSKELPGIVFYRMGRVYNREPLKIRFAFIGEQIFRQINQFFVVVLEVQQEKMVQYDGKDADEESK